MYNCIMFSRSIATALNSRHPLLMELKRMSMRRHRVCAHHRLCVSAFSHSSANAPRRAEKDLRPIIGQQARIQPKNIPHLALARLSSSSSSIDPNEIRYFEDISDPSEWMDEQHGLFRPLHAFNRIRIPWISAHLSKESKNGSPLAGKRILDVGCGAGILSTALCRVGAKVTGLDASESVIKIARSYSATLSPEIRGNIEFWCGTIEEFSGKAENIRAFDAIVASEIVEHVSDLPSFIHSCTNLVRPNSPLFFTTINRTPWSQLFAKTIAEDLLRILPQGLHDFEKFVTPKELTKLLLDEQCRVGPVLGLCYNPLLNHWDWTNFTQVNFALTAFTKKEI